MKRAIRITAGITALSLICGCGGESPDLPTGTSEDTETSVVTAASEATTGIATVPLSETTTAISSEKEDIIRYYSGIPSEVEFDGEMYSYGKTDYSQTYSYTSYFPILTNNHSHAGYVRANKETVSLMEKKLLDAHKIYNVLTGQVPREEKCNDDGVYPMKEEYGTFDSITALCAETFSVGAVYFDGVYSVNNTIPADEDIHDWLEKYMTAYLFNGKLCPSTLGNPYPPVLYSEIAGFTEAGDDIIQAELCTAILCEQEGPNGEMYQETIYTHSPVVLEKIKGEWVFTTLEYNIGKPLFAEDSFYNKKYEMPEPFTLENSSVPEEFTAYRGKYAFRFTNFNNDIIQLAGDDKFSGWIDEYNRERLNNPSLPHPTMSDFIEEFGIEKEQLINAVSDSGTPDGWIVDEADIEVLYFGDKALIEEHFKSEYAVMGRDGICTVQWLYEHNPADYFEQGIRVENIVEATYYIKGIGFADEARSAFQEKLTDYTKQHFLLAE